MTKTLYFRPMPRRYRRPPRFVSYPEIKDAAAFVWISKERERDGHLKFVASCTDEQCDRRIELGGAKLFVTFTSIELDDWRRFDSGLHQFATELIKPSGFKSNR